MDKKQIIDIEKQAQYILETLQDEEDASFLYIAGEANCFTLKGSPKEIIAQMLFAMCKYPVIKEIVMTCATNFDEVNQRFGHIAKGMHLDHEIKKIIEG